MARSRKYPQELRERAVRTVFESGRPIAQVAKDPGVGAESLRGWVRQAQADAGERVSQLTTLEGEELKRLRGENRELRRANEILKAASVFFCLGAGPEPDEVSAFVEQERACFGVQPICEVLGVSASAFYHRASEHRSAREVEDERLLALIREIHRENDEA